MRFVLLLLVMLAAGCGDQTRPTPPPSSADSPSAATVVANLDRDLHVLAELPSMQRTTAERNFGPRLRRDLEATRGTRYENKPLYLLAQWTSVHGGKDAPSETLRLLDRLEILPAHGYRSAGRLLRVQALLRLGRVAEARQFAVALDAEVPEFGAGRLVTFHELVGQTAPPLPGIAVGGGGEVPTEPFVLVAFVSTPDAAAEAWLTPRSASATAGRLRVVAVTTAGDLLAAAAVASAWGVDVRWLRQGDPALDAWRIPTLPMSVLLGPGPNRVVLAVDPRPEDLRHLAGAP